MHYFPVRWKTAVVREKFNATLHLGGSDPGHRLMGHRCPYSPGCRLRRRTGRDHTQLRLVLSLDRPGDGGDGAFAGRQPLRQPEARRGRRRTRVLDRLVVRDAVCRGHGHRAGLLGCGRTHLPLRRASTGHRRGHAGGSECSHALQLLPLGPASVGRLQRGRAGDRVLPVPARRIRARQHGGRSAPMGADAPHRTGRQRARRHRDGLRCGRVARHGGAADQQRPERRAGTARQPGLSARHHRCHDRSVPGFGRQRRDQASSGCRPSIWCWPRCWRWPCSSSGRRS